MPTVFRANGYSFYFFSHEPNEPPHVHVDRGDGGAKVWLENVAFARDSGFKPKELSQILTLVRENRTMLWRNGMGILAQAADERVSDVRCDEHNLIVALMDGRTISAPLAWYPRLFDATPEQRVNWETCGGGYGIHWPDIDEHLSTEGLLRGAPAPDWKRAA